MERLTWIWNQWINWNNLWSWIANMLTVLSLSLVFYVIIGPTKLWYYEISFVRLFFRASFFCLSMIRFSGAFLQNGSKKFSDFFHKTRISSNLKSDKVRFFWKENKLRNSFIILRDQNRFKRFSKFYEKLTCEIFMIFCVKLQQQVLKLIKLFSWGKSNSEFSSKNGFKMGTKMKFFKFYERWVHIISLMFYMNLWQLKGLKLQKCGKILYCGFRIKRDPKWVLSFATNWCI